MTEAPGIPVHDAEHSSHLNGQVSDAPGTRIVIGRSATEIASETAFLAGLDQLVQRLANEASANYQSGRITADIFHELITNYTHLRAQIRFRGRDIKK